MPAPSSSASCTSNTAHAEVLCVHMRIYFPFRARPTLEEGSVNHESDYMIAGECMSCLCLPDSLNTSGWWSKCICVSIGAPDQACAPDHRSCLRISLPLCSVLSLDSRQGNANLKEDSQLVPSLPLPLPLPLSPPPSLSAPFLTPCPTHVAMPEMLEELL